MVAALMAQPTYHMNRATLPSGHRKGRNRNTAMVAALTATNAAAVSRSCARLGDRLCSATSTAGTVKYLPRTTLAVRACRDESMRAATVHAASDQHGNRCGLSCETLVHPRG